VELRAGGIEQRSSGSGARAQRARDSGDGSSLRLGAHGGARKERMERGASGGRHGALEARRGLTGGASSSVSRGSKLMDYLLHMYVH
jgi:hypothetical protein